MWLLYILWEKYMYYDYCFGVLYYYYLLLVM